jgi:hypothetical protein
MARPRYPRDTGPRPPALPPAERTVGQAVAETVRAYGNHVRASRGLGLALGVLNQLVYGQDQITRAVVTATLGAVLMSTAYAFACLVIAGERRPAGDVLRGVALGSLTFVVVPWLTFLFVIPAVAWLALTGFVVPASVLERRRPVDAARRAVQLARADFVHVLGGLAALTIVYFLTRTALLFTLRGVGDQTLRVAAFISDVVISPILVLGAVLLFFDQAARVGSGTRPRRPDADLSDADDAHGEGRADAQVEPRTTA